MQNLNIERLIKYRNYHRPLMFNSILWSLAFVVLIFIFSKGQLPVKIDVIYTVAFLLFIAIPVVINFYVLIPSFLKKERYGLYIIAFILNIFVFSAVFKWRFQYLLDGLFPDYFFISYLSRTNIYIIFSIFLIATTLLKLAEDWFYFNTNENRILRQENQHIQTQLSSLRAQINPHFLFNSLNVIYALALDKKDVTTKAVVQLSDILRYVIYDSDSERVALKDELTLLKNYIAFQGHKMHKKDIVNFKVNIENDNYEIYPMLLLPLLENSFKHGISISDTDDKIFITITQNSDNFKFEILNSNYKNNVHFNDEYSGVGLENIQKNLELVYPNQHTFSIEEHEDNFKVTLKINTHK